jgi:hypothetical protein
MNDPGQGFEVADMINAGAAQGTLRHLRELGRVWVLYQGQATQVLDALQSQGPIVVGPRKNEGHTFGSIDIRSAFKENIYGGARVVDLLFNREGKGLVLLHQEMIIWWGHIEMPVTNLFLLLGLLDLKMGVAAIEAQDVLSLFLVEVLGQQQGQAIAGRKMLEESCHGLHPPGRTPYE